ncbi:MAG: Rnase Y domain-containing protein, partial [Candidatus Bipolaricaulota bacterium]|nr:Rnase Y domain-containing protein [Candidatus Bipolaricaulota bacterium]
MGTVLNTVSAIVSLVAAVFIGLLIGSVPRRRREAEIVAQAEEEADRLKKEKLLEGRQHIEELKDEFEERAKRREEEVARAEARILRREDRLGKKASQLEKTEDSLRVDEEEMLRLKEEGIRLLEQEKQQLEHTAEWTREQAREHLLKVVENESQLYFSKKMEEIERKARDEAEERAAHIVAT